MHLRADPSYRLQQLGGIRFFEPFAVKVVNRYSVTSLVVE